jgi:septal ring factor EnvC (AmiA/AmiB activator)
MCASESARPARGRWSALLGLTFTLVLLGAAEAQTDTLRLNALAQEGDLLLEESSALEPVRQKLLEEGNKLRTEERSLRAEVQAVNDGINTFNADMDAFNDEAKALQAACPDQSKDPEQVAACNQRVVELKDRAQKLDAKRAELLGRQEAVNKRVGEFNTASADYNKRKQEGDSRGSLNERDLEDWLMRVREFFLSADFKTMSSGPPPITVCDDAYIGSLGTLSSSQALKQAQACLKAVQTGVP